MYYTMSACGRDSLLRTCPPPDEYRVVQARSPVSTRNTRCFYNFSSEIINLTYNFLLRRILEARGSGRKAYQSHQ